MEVLARVLLFEKLCGVLRVRDRPDFEAVTEVGERGRLAYAGRGILPRTVVVSFAAENHVVVACRPVFDEVKTGE